MSETLSNFHVWVCTTYVLETKLQKPGVKIPKWDPRSRRGINMGFSKMDSTQVGLVLNLLTGSISPQNHVVFDDMFSTVMISTAAYPEVWIRLVTSSKSRIQVMLDKEDDTELDDEWLNADEELTRFRKARDQIVGRVKGSESTYVQGPQSSEEDLVVRERVPSRTEIPQSENLELMGNMNPLIKHRTVVLVLTSEYH